MMNDLIPIKYTKVTADEKIRWQCRITECSENKSRQKYIYIERERESERERGGRGGRCRE